MSDTRYARNGSVHIAYQVLSDGPIDVVVLPGILVSIDSFDDHPLMRRFISRFTSFARVIVLDRRGVGQSDAIADAFPQPDVVAEDLLAVFDDAGVTAPAIVACYEAATCAIALAALHPDRISSLVLMNAFSKFMRADDHEWGFDPSLEQSFERIVEGTSQSEDGDLLALLAPSVAHDDRFRDWWDRAGRRAASPATALRYGELVFTVDVRDRLSEVAVPTLVVHKRDNIVVRVEEARYMASKIPSAKIIEIDGRDCVPWVDADGMLDAAQEFLTGTSSTPADRVLATVLFTDIVDSTRLATELGDRRWRELLDIHDATTKRVLAREGGKLIKQTGDGSLSTFAGPGPAIRCAMAMREALAPDGIRIRAGIHTGEVEVRGDDVGGIAVHIAARVMGEAGPDEIIVSNVVPPLVVGSTIEFADRGPRELKGVPGEWRVLSVEG